ncbi:cupin domain-containing protein [candidate division KSB1 bacterium]|nr:cupin domain-containing protein [candidate division KSB1 bacterium]
MTLSNLLKNIPSQLPDEALDVLAKTQSIRIERIISYGHSSPDDYWYDQDETEWVMVVSGNAKLQFRETGDEITMVTGDWIEIPAHCRHRISWTDPGKPTIWLAIFY